MSAWPRFILELSRKRDVQRLKAGTGMTNYRSAEALHPITPKAGVLGTPALRHPRTSAGSSFSASCEAMPLQS